MHFLSSIDWGFLEAFFGEHGKLVTTCLAVVGAFVGLIALLVKYLHAKVMEKERDDARADLRKAKAALENEQNRMQQQLAVLKDKEVELDRKNRALTAAAVKLNEHKSEIESREKKLNVIRSAFHGREHDLWCVHMPRQPGNYNHRLWVQRHRPIITVANLKGGVGKTTVTANLAAFFGQAGMRVLLIDVDYQGSLSNMLLSADRVLESSAEVNKLFEPGCNATTFMSAARPLQNVLTGSAIVSADYEFASCENRVMIEYLLNEEKDDGRYRLAKLLLDEDVAGTYDIVLIDAPPRLTAGTINALCASTHLLIPTVYDRLSAEAVGTFLNGVQVIKTHLNHRIELLGVVGTLTYQADLTNRERQAKNIAVSEVQKVWGANYHFFDRHIPRRAAIAAAAGESLAYIDDVTVKKLFDELGNEVLDRLKLPAAAPPGAKPQPKGWATQQTTALQHGAEA
jgi:cellulose biosynthesis protein BcsQ